MPEKDIDKKFKLADYNDQETYAHIFPIIYKQLQIIARSIRFNFNGLETLNTTAIVHEAYIKLASKSTPWESRTHFFSVAAKAMRQVLLNAARSKSSEKRGGDALVINIDDVGDNIILSPTASEKLIDFDNLLVKLEEKDLLYGKIVECRFFAGLSIEETADALHISPATVKRKWQLARDWLYVHLPK
ncbi:MAG TPA: ECF-type sigma factor [Cyclobacteriaceae bacterium]|nr:ECF-type sigma factor [Cyclobacteriaceae bacterium]